LNVFIRTRESAAPLFLTVQAARISSMRAAFVFVSVIAFDKIAPMVRKYRNLLELEQLEIIAFDAGDLLPPIGCVRASNGARSISRP
jgi:hypothetical protein